MYSPSLLLNFYQSRGGRLLAFLVVAIFVGIDENKPGRLYRCQNGGGQGEGAEVRHGDWVPGHPRVGSVVAANAVDSLRRRFRRLLPPARQGVGTPRLHHPRGWFHYLRVHLLKWIIGVRLRAGSIVTCVFCAKVRRNPLHTKRSSHFSAVLENSHSSNYPSPGGWRLES